MGADLTPKKTQMWDSDIVLEGKGLELRPSPLRYFL